jgi:hypothetical protein
MILVNRQEKKHASGLISFELLNQSTAVVIVHVPDSAMIINEFLDIILPLVE